MRVREIIETTLFVLVIAAIVWFLYTQYEIDKRVEACMQKSDWTVETCAPLANTWM